jgi:type I restriction enzyme R subunit
MYNLLDEEHYVENTFLAQVQRLGWKIYRQNKADPEDTKEITNFTSGSEPVFDAQIKLRDSFREVILEDELKKSIKKINTWIEEDQINEVVRRITTPTANSMLEANREIHDLLLENTSVSENRQTGEKSPTVRFIDFETPENNSFIAISQFKVNIPGTEKHIVPDIVLFVNGLPLIVIECKSPAITDPITEAITQLMRYSNRRGVKEGNEKLFWFNLFTIATSNQVAKHGSITSEYEHFVEWKDPYPYSLSDISPDRNITSQQVLIQGMLTKEIFLDILHTFTVFKEGSKGNIIKIVVRYQQFRAVKKILKRIEEGKTPEERGGIVWHTQGSGKSLTMMFTVRAMYHDPELSKFKVVFVTDRKDLEKQLRETSKSVGFTVNLARTINKLQSLLRTDTPDLVMGMIHKFQERELKRELPLLNESPNILIMIDEAHRTQYKFLGANLKKALPNAVRIAFTGTPIEKTEKTFGYYIDKYSIRQSVEDGVTVEIVYEGRTHSAEISDEEAANKRFEDVFSAVDSEQKVKIMGRYTWRAYLEDENVIRDKAKDMIEHYAQHVFPNGFKAQVVTVSRLAAIRYKKALEVALTEKIKQLKSDKRDNNVDIERLEKLNVGVVISGTPNDTSEYHPYTDPNMHDKIIRSFKLPFDKMSESGIKGDVGILVVQSMLITGFDAEIEQVMYLDNVLKEHTLLQAIARVNRVYKNKSCGFVVDYVGVLKRLKEALSIYANDDIEEITQVIVDKSKSIDELKFIHNLISDFFKEYDIGDNWREDIDDCVDLLVDEETRNEFIALVRRFNRVMDKVLPDPEALKYVTDLKIINFIKQSARNRYRDDKLSIKDASRKIREIVEEYLISKGVNPKIDPFPLLSDKFLTDVKRKQSGRARAEEVKYAIIEHIEKHYDTDPEFYERFSDKLKQILEQYKENWDILAIEYGKIIEEMKKGREEEETFGFNPKKEMPFFGLLKNEIYGKTPIEKLENKDIYFLVSLTKDATEIIKRETKIVDFWENYTKQKRLRSFIISRLLNSISSVSKQTPSYYLVKERSQQYSASFNKRNEIAQKMMELAYHVYGR